MIQFGTIKLCKTLKNYFGQFVWIEKIFLKRVTIIVASHFMKRRLKTDSDETDTSYVTQYILASILVFIIILRYDRTIKEPGLLCVLVTQPKRKCSYVTDIITIDDFYHIAIESNHSLISVMEKRENGSKKHEKHYIAFTVR